MAYLDLFSHDTAGLKDERQSWSLRRFVLFVAVVSAAAWALLALLILSLVG